MSRVSRRTQEQKAVSKPKRCPKAEVHNQAACAVSVARGKPAGKIHFEDGRCRSKSSYSLERKNLIRQGIFFCPTIVGFNLWS